MSKVRHGYVLKISMSVLLTFLVSTSYAQGLSTSHSNDPEDENKRVEDLEKRLQQLEPPKPTTIVTLPWEIETEKHYPSNTIPISEVMEKGTKIHFNVIKNDSNYKRPVYEEHWHSTYRGGRWSYVPMRIQYALHRLFTTYDIRISGELNFKQNVGIDFPMFQNKTDLDLYIIVFQTTVTDVSVKQPSPCHQVEGCLTLTLVRLSFCMNCINNLLFYSTFNASDFITKTYSCCLSPKVVIKRKPLNRFPGS